MARKRVVGVVDVDAVRVLQLPLSPSPLQSLPTPLPLHVRPDREEPDQTRPDQYQPVLDEIENVTLG